MDNCIILGFGRSGTSLIGGLLFNSGYFLGDHLHPARHSNPKGFFEDIIINRINEDILNPFDYGKKYKNIPKYTKPFSPYNPGQGHRWLAYVDPAETIECRVKDIIKRIKDSLKCKRPFAFKDPRFNLTINVWLKYLPQDTKILCVFRNPTSVISSIIKECGTMEYMSDFYIDDDLVLKIWHNNYSYFLNNFYEKHARRTLFVSYERLIQGGGFENIENHINSSINRDFLEPELNRSPNIGVIPGYVESLYNKLMELSTK